MKRNEIVYLEITSWQGISIGAEHYYGKLRVSDQKDVEIEKAMSVAEAKRLSKKDDWEYKPGRKTSRFDDRDEIIKIAKSIYMSKFPGARALILGHLSTADPQEIIHCDVGCTRANLVWEQFEAMGGFSKKENDAQADILYRKWNAIIEDM